MNIDHLRRSLRDRWLDYYQDNRSWISRLSIWVNCEGERRPSASFILGALSSVEPRLIDLLPLIVDLSNHPDRIVIALGLNFDPEQELTKLKLKTDPDPKYLPASTASTPLPSRPAKADEACEGRGKTTPSR